MKKSELIERVSQTANCSHTQAELVVNKVFSTIEDALKDGNRVELRGFGTFEVRSYDAYKGRNPKTGASVAVAPKRSPFFKAGKELREGLKK